MLKRLSPKKLVDRSLSLLTKMRMHTLPQLVRQQVLLVWPAIAIAARVRDIVRKCVCGREVQAKHWSYDSGADIVFLAAALPSLTSAEWKRGQLSLLICGGQATLPDRAMPCHPWRPISPRSRMLEDN